MFNSPIGNIDNQNNKSSSNIPINTQAKYQQPLLPNTPVTQGGHIDIQNIVNSVFQNKDKKNNLPANFLGA